MTVDRVQGGAFDAALGGSGNMALGSLQVDRADISIGGSGNVTAAGSARSLKVSLGGSGNLQARGAPRRQRGRIGRRIGRRPRDGRRPGQVSVVGSGTVDLGRGARCTVTRMGKAQVRCGS